MLLESSLFLINIFSKNIYLLILVTIILLILNFKINKNFINKIKKIGKFMLIYLFYSLISIFFYKTGRILFSFGKYYITYEGVFINLIKIISLNNLFLFSFYISEKFKKNPYKITFKEKKWENLKNYYKDIFIQIFENVPYILSLIEKKVKFSDSYKKILQKVYRNL